MTNAQPFIHETKRRVEEDAGTIIGLVIYEADLESRIFTGQLRGGEAVEFGPYWFDWKAVASSERKFDITCTRICVPEKLPTERKLVYNPRTDELIKKYITEEILRYESGEK